MLIQIRITAPKGNGIFLICLFVDVLNIAHGLLLAHGLNRGLGFEISINPSSLFFIMYFLVLFLIKKYFNIGKAISQIFFVN